ncbi:TPA: inovirus Gp2 family protein [Pseudomonas aeruginosa]|nr:inovirus Gp2 family protein [Pseudomonas aeruginosa]HBP5646113.1 inovirus Gp2 family protein [Pseudomonas aeruginosa]HBP6624613.1 inovirus Gp2 family protein [Pseudomonas aeruginosa]
MVTPCILLLSKYPYRDSVREVVHYFLKPEKGYFLINKVTSAPSFKGVEINSGEFRNLGLYVEILDSYLSQIRALLTHYSRITILRFDLHLPDCKFFSPNEGNQLVSVFFKSLKEHLSRKQWKGHKHVIFGWAREVEEKAKGHYHCFIGIRAAHKFIGEFLNREWTHLWGLLEKRWKCISRGSMQVSRYHTVNRGIPEELDKAFKHISYLAKTKGKSFGTGEHYKRYATSRIKPKQQDDHCKIAA